MDRQTCIVKRKDGSEYVACANYGTEQCSIHSGGCKTCPKMKAIFDKAKKEGYNGDENELGEIISYLFDTECRRYGNYYVVEEAKNAS